MDNVYKCPKCEKNISIENKIMHDLNCKGTLIKTNKSLPNQQQQEQSMSLNGLGKLKKSFSVNQNHNSDETIFCTKCGNSVPIVEFDDHLFSHQLQENEDQIEDNQHSNSQESRHNRGNANSNDIAHVYHQQHQQHQHRQPNYNDNSNSISYNQNIIPESQQNQLLQQNISINRTMTTNNQGYSTETITQKLPNGHIQTTSIIRDSYGNVISQRQTQEYNRHNDNNSYTMNIMPGINQVSVNMRPQMQTQRRRMNMPNLNTSNFDRHYIQNTFMNNPFFNQMILSNNHEFDRGIIQLIQQVMNHEHPVSDEIINELPVINIDDPNKLEADKKQCVICLADYQNGEKAIILPCIHLFHSDCIKNWFRTQNTCPICKFKLNPE